MWDLTLEGKSVIKFYSASENWRTYLYSPLICVQIYFSFYMYLRKYNYKMNCNVRNLLFKMGYFVAVSQVCCKILVWCCCNSEKTPKPSHSAISPFFSPLFSQLPIQLTVFACRFSLWCDILKNIRMKYFWKWN